VRTDLLKKIKEDKIKIKIVVSNENRGRASRDDYLSNNLLSWLEINLNAKNQPYYDLRDIIVEGKSKVNVEFKKNNRSSQGQMIIYYPNNHPNSADFNERVQSQVFRP